MYASSCFVFRSRVSPRRATYFLLLRQKKVGKEKATLLSASLRFATGSLRCSTPEGVRRTRFAQTAAALIPPTSALLGAARRERSAPSLRSAEQPQRAFAALGQAFNSSGSNDPAVQLQAQRARSACWAPAAERSDGPLVSPPLWLRRGAQRFADKGSPLSERSEFGRDPAKREHRRLPRSAAKGSQTVGSPFLCLLSFGEAKESESAAGPRPGPGKRTQNTTQKGASQ